LESIELGKMTNKETPPKANTTSVAEELTKLKNLLDSGVLTQLEFDEQKRRLLQ